MLFYAKKLYKIMVCPLYSKALVRGCAAGVEHEAVLKEIEYKTVLDIGANRGQFALAARRLNSQAVIHSFEPLQNAVQVYQKVFGNDDKSILHPYAIGPKSEKKIMHISRRDDSSSLLPITPTQNEIFPGTEECGITEVRTVPLPEVLPKADLNPPVLMKIDVQGFELPVLEGCWDYLDYIDHIYVECSFLELYKGQALVEDVMEFLKNRKYRLKGIYNVTYDHNGKSIQADFFFSKQFG